MGARRSHRSAGARQGLLQPGPRARAAAAVVRGSAGCGSLGQIGPARMRWPPAHPLSCPIHEAGGAARMPLFMVASASEASAPTNAPAWRTALGNLAAGAVAGCAVESGAARPHPATRSLHLHPLHTQLGCPPACSAVPAGHHQDAPAGHDWRRRLQGAPAVGRRQGPVRGCASARCWRPGSAAVAALRSLRTRMPSDAPAACPPPPRRPVGQPGRRGARQCSVHFRV